MKTIVFMILILFCVSIGCQSFHFERFFEKDKNRDIRQEVDHKQVEDNGSSNEGTSSLNKKKLIELESEDPSELTLYCLKQLQGLPGQFRIEELTEVCGKVQQEPICVSTEGRPIFHYLKSGSLPVGKKVLVGALIHGDEAPSGTIARSWMERLTKIDPRNSWLIIPILNPDGYKKSIRMNANNVDLNRNFPTQDWVNKALDHWKIKTKSNKRRYPGPGPASEIETQCFMRHIANFKPDLIISIHTPLGVLDFDGPTIDFPKYDLPWIRLGHFPGSLGRYMWYDNKVPVLTIELKGNDPIKQFDKIDQLHDITGLVAIMSSLIKDNVNNADQKEIEVKSNLPSSQD